MSETKTEYRLEFRRKGGDWRTSDIFTAKAKAEKEYANDRVRFPQYEHRLIRVTVLKESK